jgi:hypothetical protein
MIWIARIFLTISLLGGVARLLLFFLNGIDIVQSFGLTMSKQKMLVFGIVNIAFSILGFVLLATETFGPMEILFGILIMTSLPEIAFNIVRPRPGV